MLQSGKLAQNPAVTSMTDRAEIVAIIIREKRIASSQRRVVNTKVLFEHCTASANRMEPIASCSAAAVIPAQIWQCLFAFKNRSHPEIARLGSIGGDIHAITTFWHDHLRCTRRIAIRLRPQESKTLQPKVSVGFTAI